jgi:hypothetical protein
MADAVARFDDLGVARADPSETLEEALESKGDAAPRHHLGIIRTSLQKISRKGTLARLHSKIAREPHKIKPLKAHDEGGVLSPRMARRPIKRSSTVMRFLETHPVISPVIRISSQSTAVPEFVHNFIETSIEYMAHIQPGDVPVMLRHWARSTALIVLCVASGLLLFIPFALMYRLALEELANVLSSKECSRIAAIGAVHNSSSVQNSSIGNETVFGTLRISLPLSDFGRWDAEVRAEMEGSSAGRLILGAQILRSVNTALFSYCTFLLAGWTCFGLKWLHGYPLLIAMLGGSLHVAIEIVAYRGSVSSDPEYFMSWVYNNSSWLLILLHLVTGKHSLRPMSLFESLCSSPRSPPFLHDTFRFAGIWLLGTAFRGMKWREWIWPAMEFFLPLLAGVVRACARVRTCVLGCVSA